MLLTWMKKRHVGTPVASSRTRLQLAELENRTVPAVLQGFLQSGLVSDIPGLAPHTDADLTNPWGFSETNAGQFRVSANGAGNAPLFDARGDSVGPVIVIPPPAGSPAGTTSTPNGNLTNTTSDFVISANGRSAPATLIFSTEDGTIAAWNPKINRTQAMIAADQSGSGAVYKLIAMGSMGGNNFLYATDFHNGKIDVFDKNFNKVTLGMNGFGTFADPNTPAGFAPFGIKNIDGTMFVSYAKQRGPDNHDDQEGPGNGFIDEFDSAGNFLMRFASGTAAGGTLTQLNSPIGMAIAPAGYGPTGMFGGALLVGNFGDSHVSAFDLKTGNFLGQLSDPTGHPLTLNDGIGGDDTKGLWGIGFGNGHGGADPNTLYFASGINDEADGVFGQVKAVGQNRQNDHDHDRDDRMGDNHGPALRFDNDGGRMRDRDGSDDHGLSVNGADLDDVLRTLNNMKRHDGDGNGMTHSEVSHHHGGQDFDSINRVFVGRH